MSDLKAWMGAHDENDESLSRKVGVSRVQIRRIRLGENRPSPETALRLQEVTGIPAASFIFDQSSAA